jgi:hypothetical protein
VFDGRISPPQPIAIDKYYPAQHALVIHARNPVRQWKERLQPLHLCICQPEKITHAAPPWIPKLNQTSPAKASVLIGPDPEITKTLDAHCKYQYFVVEKYRQV